jgi:L-2,4-diaminobutyrate transaminase
MAVQSTHNLSLKELDRRSFLHPFTAIAEHFETGPRVMTRGKGVWVEDIDGKTYLDSAAGLWCVNIGYGQTRVADAIYEQSVLR